MTTLMKTRSAAVAGQFYPRDPRVLEDELQIYLQEEISAGAQPKKAMAIVVPHAGYIYSGRVAASVFSRVEIPSRVFILSPNHTGEGAAVALNSEGEWMTPLGAASIDKKLANDFATRCLLAEEDTLAHESEHSLEVQLPFLQYLKKNFSFVPLTLQHLSYEECVQIGEALADCILNSGEEILIIASSDMNHYESEKETLKKDQVAIDAILALDPKALYENVHRRGVTMCGIIPTTISLIAAKKQGAQKAKLVKHQTSGQVTGDFHSVVGYAGLIIS